MHNDILANYGRALRKMRQDRDLSQEELADLCGLHRTYISDIELGKRNVSLENIDKIADALDMNLSYFFTEVEKYESV